MNITDDATLKATCWESVKQMAARNSVPLYCPFSYSHDVSPSGVRPLSQEVASLNKTKQPPIHPAPSGLDGKRNPLLNIHIGMGIPDPSSLQCPNMEYIPEINSSPDAYCKRFIGSMGPRIEGYKSPSMCMYQKQMMDAPCMSIYMWTGDDPI